jgi:hypothetical protein
MVTVVKKPFLVGSWFEGVRYIGIMKAWEKDDSQTHIYIQILYTVKEYIQGVRAKGEMKQKS